jgi:hypothetical protein
MAPMRSLLVSTSTILSATVKPLGLL